jgi:DNA adenine methylase
MLEARPFLKWAGGKTQLLEPLLEVFPKRVNTYYEPFLGGGAVFFAMAMQKRFQRAVINDWNQEIIEVYKTIRDYPEDLIGQLARLKYSREVYEELRRIKTSSFSPVRRAARTIYLNKTGFNGLYRVNKKGEFNVPFGKFKTPPRIFEEGNILGCAQALNQFVKIMSTDFATVCDEATEGDLVYFDPPYVPLTPTSDFTSYTSKGFGLKDQERLARLFRSLARRGVAVVSSNSDTETVRKLYEGFEMRVVQARRNINSKADRRGPVGELLIVSVPAALPKMTVNNATNGVIEGALA